MAAAAQKSAFVAQRHQWKNQADEIANYVGDHSDELWPPAAGDVLVMRNLTIRQVVNMTESALRITDPMHELHGTRITLALPTFSGGGTCCWRTHTTSIRPPMRWRASA